jgi:hypothetical protein
VSENGWIDHHISTDQNIITVTVFGRPVLQDYLDIVDTLESDPHFSPSLNRLCDFTTSDDASLSTIDSFRFIARLRKFPITALAKTALVSERGPSWLFLSMVVNKMYSGESRLFDDRDLAYGWLEINDPVTDV